MEETITFYAVPGFITFIIGLVALIAGDTICSRVALLKRLSIPGPVLGGLLVALMVVILELTSGIKIDFATNLRDLLILLFFVSLGFTAKLSELKTGGKPLFIICLVTVALLVLQNLAGIGVAMVWGAHPFYGLLAGSISFVGGPGTALAWGKEAGALGLKGAELVGVSAATFAVAIGALISGPVVTWIIKRHQLKSSEAQSNLMNTGAETVNVIHAADSKSLIRTMLLLAVAVWLGNQLNAFAQSREILLPGFLCSLLAGMVITNIADIRHIKLPMELTGKAGDISLQIFLAISLMSLKLSSIGNIILPLAIVVVIQVLLSAAVTYFILFRALGKDYDAAVVAGGFLGFAISSMPIAMATMEQVTKRFGPAPRAILLITLAGSFFVDLANAIIVKGFAALLPAIAP